MSAKSIGLQKLSKKSVNFDEKIMSFFFSKWSDMCEK